MENVFKNWFTSLLGASIMGLTTYDWFFNPTSEMTPRETAVAAIVGFTLLFMKDAISGWINQLVVALIDKFKGNKTKEDGKDQ